MDQWNRTECPEINPGIYGQLIFDKDAKTTKWEKINLSANWLTTMDMHIQNNEVPLSHTIYTK